MRATIGLFAVVLLIAAVVTRGGENDTFSGACFRVALMMTLWWFAYPQVKHMPRWLAVTGGVMAFLVILRPKLLLLAVPVLIVLWLLRPRVPRGNAARRRNV